jgi:HAD superfamily hydrolase (TIGR01509 family)
LYCGVLFDWDGTLADTRKVILVSFQQALNIVDVQADIKFIERQIGTGAEQTFRIILQNAGKVYDDTLIKRLMEEKVRTQIKFGCTVKLFPGARELLEELQGKVKLALASMNNRPVIEDLLLKIGLKDCFNVVVTVEEVRKFKPDPEIFIKTVDKLHLSPAECLVVEDSLFGVKAAKEAGIDCIAVLTGAYNKAEMERAKPELIVNSLSEKEKILNFILKG